VEHTISASVDRPDGDVKARTPRIVSTGRRLGRGRRSADSWGGFVLGSQADHRPLLVEWGPGSDVSGLHADEIRVWIIELDAGVPRGSDIDATEPGPELAILSDDERARAARFVRARDRRRFARCRAALREILGALLGEPADSLKFRSFAKGKPELDRGPGVIEPLRFNLSHSDNLALVAVGLGREVGVDLERFRPISEAERIVASFFTTAEQEAFAAIREPDRAAAFLRGWTRKEAVLKGFGMGISGLAARHETGFGASPLMGVFTQAQPVARVDRWMMWEAAPRPGFVAALAVDVGHPPLLGAGEAGAATDGSLPAGPPRS
jgi:4'-phosphopantetheinyl transferase